MRKRATIICIAILAAAVCSTVIWLFMHQSSSRILTNTENSVPTQAEDQLANDRLSDCCCGDSDKPKPKAFIVCVVNDKATKKVEPDYPQEAQAARISGDVQVEVVVDEAGRVIWAQAVSGNPLLQKESLKAACQWQFAPTVLAGMPVKVNGVITFKFRLD